MRYTGDHPEPSDTKDRNYRTECMFLHLLLLTLTLLTYKLDLKLKYIDKKWARSDAAPFFVDPDEVRPPFSPYHDSN